MVVEEEMGEKMTKEEVMEIAKDTAPPFLLPVIEKAAPVLAILGTVIDVVGPYVEKAIGMAVAFWAFLQPYHPEEAGLGLLGLLVAFFGGHFMVTIATIEAFRMTGWETTKNCILSLWEDYKVVKAAYEKDNLVDADNDGTYDVLQLSKKDLTTRKLRLILRTANPVTIQSAIGGINAGVIAVVATLRVQFAESITLGASIGSTLIKFSEKTLHPALEAAIPAEYAKWIDPVLHYVCQAIGVSIAYSIQRVISTFHAAIRGGYLATKGILHYCGRRGFAPAAKVEEGSMIYTAMALGIAALGFLFQISSFFGLPFPLNVLFFPVSIVEYVITWVVFE